MTELLLKYIKLINKHGSHSPEIAEFIVKNVVHDDFLMMAAAINELVISREHWQQSAKEFLTNELYYHGLLNEIGEIIGQESYICDDQTVSQEVLVAKLPSLVKQIKERNS